MHPVMFVQADEKIDDVLVVYCSLYPDSLKKETYVVGWYQHATVYRNYQVMRFSGSEGKFCQKNSSPFVT